MGSRLIHGPDYRAGGKDIPISCRISRRAKHISLRLEPDNGLVLVIPQGSNPITAEQFLLSQHNWIERHAKHYRGKPEEKPLRLFGEAVTLVVDRSGASGKRHFSSHGSSVRIITGPDDAAGDTELFLQFLKPAARQVLLPRAAWLAKEHNFPARRFIIRSQKSRWGSCSAKGTISLNSKLCMHRREVIDYLIFHELCHLRHMNHSPAFWREVARYVPDYKALRKELRRG